MSTATSPQPTAQTAFGFAVAATSALSLSVVTTAAHFAYAGGTDPVTLVAARAALGFLCVSMLVFALRWLPRFGAADLPALIGMSIGQLMINFGYMTSVLYIPVSLAALIFYIFPVLVLAIDAGLSRRMPSATVGAAFLAAFAGLGLALAPSFGTLDVRGLIAALAATLGSVMLMLFGSRATRRVGALSTLFFMQFFACAVTVAVMLAFGGPTPPVMTVGWSGLAAAGAGYVVGVGLQVVAFRNLDPSPTALVYNLEPLGTLVIAALVLDERMNGLQYFGCALVLGALVAAGQHWARQR
jgi:drug/metabolite transporter (DMT)-like permease